MSSHSIHSSHSAQPPGGSSGALGLSKDSLGDSLREPLLSSPSGPFSGGEAGTAFTRQGVGVELRSYVPPVPSVFPDPRAALASRADSLESEFKSGFRIESAPPASGSAPSSSHSETPPNEYKPVSDREASVPESPSNAARRSLLPRRVPRKTSVYWKRGTIHEVLKSRRVKWNLAAMGTYAAMGVTLALGVVVGIEYWNSAIKLEILAKLHLLILGALGSSMSNAAQTIYFLSFFVRDTFDFWRELNAGALRNYSNKMTLSVPFCEPVLFEGRHVVTARVAPFFLARTLILGTAVFNSLPVILASNSNIEVGMLSLLLLALMNYSSVSKLLGDRLPLLWRKIFASPETKGRIALEQDIQFQIGRIIQFLEHKTTTPEQKREIKEIILQSNPTTLEAELMIIAQMIKKIGEFKLAQDREFKLAAYLNRKGSTEAPAEKSQEALSAAVGSSLETSRDLLSGSAVAVRLKDGAKIAEIQTELADQSCHSYLPSCSARNVLKSLLGVVFFQYAFDQLPSTISGIHKVLMKLSFSSESSESSAFLLGLIAMSVSLIRYFDWAGMLFQKFEDSFALVKQHPTLRSSIYVALSSGVILALVSPAGSTEVALKGLNNYSKVNMYFLTEIFKKINDAGVALLFAAIPGFISGSVMNSPGNMSMAVSLLLAVHDLIQLYAKSDRTAYIESLENDDLTATLKKLKTEVGDNRHFNLKDLNQIEDAILKTANPDAERAELTEAAKDEMSATRRRAAAENNSRSRGGYSSLQDKDTHRPQSVGIFGVTSPIGRNRMFLSPSTDNLSSGGVITPQPPIRDWVTGEASSADLV